MYVSKKAILIISNETPKAWANIATPKAKIIYGDVYVMGVGVTMMGLLMFIYQTESSSWNFDAVMGRVGRPRQGVGKEWSSRTPKMFSQDFSRNLQKIMDETIRTKGEIVEDAISEISSVSEIDISNDIYFVILEM